MKTDGTITIEGYTIRAPASYPVSLKEFMRLVIGGTVPSARTETNRTAIFRKYLIWLNSEEKDPRGIAEAYLAMLRKNGFPRDPRNRFKNWATKFLQWRRDLLTYRAQTAANARWNKFDKGRKRRKVNQARGRHSSSIRSKRKKLT